MHTDPIYLTLYALAAAGLIWAGVRVYRYITTDEWID